MNKWIIFDLMDTLIVDPYHRALPRLMNEDDLERWRQFRNPEAFFDFESGFISEHAYVKSFYKEEYRSQAADLPGPLKMKKEMMKAVGYRPGMKAMLDLISGLQKGWQSEAVVDSPVSGSNRYEHLSTDFGLAIASNYGIWYHEVLARLPGIADYFDALFFSCEMGKRKPDAAFFSMIERSIMEFSGRDCEPVILFFDDRSDNLQAAEKHGWYVSDGKADADSMKQRILGFLES